MGLCWSKEQRLLVTPTPSQRSSFDGKSLPISPPEIQMPDGPRWTRITEVSQETESKEFFPGMEPEPLEI
jgi:hypothetical protein